MKDIAPILKSLGLNDSEVKTYLTALENGASAVIDLSKLARLSRQATYLAIESLTKRGIMTSVVHGKKRLYSAEHPSKLLSYARRQEAVMKEHINDLERSIPELELQVGGDRPVVKVYEGKEGIKVIIEEMEKSGRAEYLEFTDLEAMYKVLTPEELQPLRLALGKLQTKAKGIYVGQAISQQRPQADRHTLPPEYGGFKTNVTIYTDKIIIATFAGKMTSVIIESELIAKTFRTLYLLAFETAKSFPKV